MTKALYYVYTSFGDRVYLDKYTNKNKAIAEAKEFKEDNIKDGATKCVLVDLKHGKADYIIYEVTV